MRRERRAPPLASRPVAAGTPRFRGGWVVTAPTTRVFMRRPAVRALDGVGVFAITGRSQDSRPSIARGRTAATSGAGLLLFHRELRATAVGRPALPERDHGLHPARRDRLHDDDLAPPGLAAEGLVELDLRSRG